MAHKSVVRNVACQASSFNVRERHNERKNDEYFNGDVVPDREHLNVHYCRRFREDGTPETYQETFDRLLAERKIVKHGTKPDAKLFCEMVFDINTSYFDERGGYEYAKKFYEEAYRLAVKEAGGEDYIISAVLHADERNSALSEQLGRDVYHYHLHVVYVPVVEKKLYFRKNNKDPNLAGKLKEVIPQISQSNKWPLRVTMERDGKKYTVNSYSLLQDRYHEHMKAAGFDGFERGERGSTTEHLEVLQYKIQQDTARLKQLDAQVEKTETRLGKLDEQITVKEKAKATIAEVTAMGRALPLVPGVHLTDDEAKRLKSLAKKGVGIDKRAEEYKKKIAALDVNIRDLNGRIDDLNRSVRSIASERDSWKTNYERLWADVKPFINAIRTIPQKMLAFINEHLPQKAKAREESL